MEELPVSQSPFFKRETSKDGINIEWDVKDNVNAILTVPVWAKNDFFIKDMILAKKWCFVVIKSFWDEYLDGFKPPYHRWYIYFDWNKYYIKRWKAQYIWWVPFRMCGENWAEEILIWWENYWNISHFSKDEFLLNTEGNI